MYITKNKISSKSLLSLLIGNHIILERMTQNKFQNYSCSRRLLLKGTEFNSVSLELKLLQHNSMNVPNTVGGKEALKNMQKL